MHWAGGCGGWWVGWVVGLLGWFTLLSEGYLYEARPRFWGFLGLCCTADHWRPPKNSPANANPQQSDKSESFFWFFLVFLLCFICISASPACNCWTTEFSSFHYVCTWGDWESHLSISLLRDDGWCGGCLAWWGTMDAWEWVGGWGWNRMGMAMRMEGQRSRAARPFWRSFTQESVVVTVSQQPSSFP